MDIWVTCQEEVTLSAVECEAIRMAESHKQVATSSLLDGLFPQPAL